jgi:acyl-CoA synthetase (NDP forming)
MSVLSAQPTKSTLDVFFHAKSFAVVGASTHRLKVGHQILRNLRQVETEAGAKQTDFKLYPINPEAKIILGLPVFASLTAVVEPIDVVVIATPAVTVSAIIDEIILRNQNFSAHEKTKGVILITAGFAEIGEAGKNLQAEIAQKLAAAGIALLGPNTLGLLNPHHNLNASFAQREVLPGNLGLISQSGAILAAMFDALNQRACGVSFAVSLGNKAGITENEALEFALHDPNTSAVLLYMESFSDLPTFLELVSRVKQTKPVVLLKGGTSQRGQQASSSHTAALATNQTLLAAAAPQVGFTMVDTLEEFLAVAFFCAQHKTLPENVMVITNAGGPAVTAIDDLQKKQVPLAVWTKRGEADLEDSLPKIPPHNPLDLLGDATPESFAQALKIAQHDVNIDSALIIVTPQSVTDMRGIVEQLIQHRGRMPLFVSLIGGDHLEPLRHLLRENKIMANDFPNESVETLGLLHKINQNRYHGQIYNALINTHKSAPDKHPIAPPSLDETFHLLRHYGFMVPKYEIITGANLSKLVNLNYPLFAKTANPLLLHKKQIGAIYGIVHNAAEAHEAYQKMKQFGEEMLLQELIEIDQEILLGVERDPQFGWYMTVGMGGSLTNLLADREYVFLSASKMQMQTAWLKTKAAAALKDQPKVSARVVELMYALQTLVHEQMWIKNLEINPLAVTVKGILAADIKVQV